ncbi:MAG: DNA-binding protein [Gammaproteobacteria bacterium RIFOXYA12_FULL_61_12]|nr:MAG: DNA-binding protein [Gammaproteobacteria bacterium RIFOXYD12_FULL_61_37]OGT93458.1 MAG: DNA-binding protein [Gammaproteobacteria bacterium RIFOXYA12_FULL_61_12]
MGATNGQDSLVVIADAGPLIHLDELAALDLLGDYRQVLVPDAVWREVERHRPEALQSSRICLSRQPLQDTAGLADALTAMYTLHAGEREALALCLAQPKSLLLTDDTAARMAASVSGIDAHGTVGLLIRAVRRRLRSKEEVLRLLADIPRRSTLHIRPSFLADIIREVDESA